MMMFQEYWLDRHPKPTEEVVSVLLKEIQGLRHQMLQEQEGALMFIAALVVKYTDTAHAHLTEQELREATKFELSRGQSADGVYIKVEVPDPTPSDLMTASEVLESANNVIAMPRRPVLELPPRANLNALAAAANLIHLARSRGDAESEVRESVDGQPDATSPSPECPGGSPDAV